MLFKGVVAVDSRWGYSKDNSIPWNFKKDLENFKKTTLNSNVLMGYNTYMDIAQRRSYPLKNKILLKDRLSIILTSKNDLHLSDDCIVVHSFDEVKNLYLKYDTTWFLGGVSIFDYGLNIASEWIITTINKSYNCDKKFNHKKLKDNFIKNNEIYKDEDLTIERWITK